MRNRTSLVVGSVVFAILILRISLPGADPGEGRTLQATALIGAGCGLLLTLAAIRMRWPVAGTHAAVLAPLLVAAALALVIEDAAGRGGGNDTVVELMGTLRTAVESGSLRLEDLVIFAAAFWTIAAFFVHATVEGSPRIAILAPLVAALAVTVIDPVAASFPRLVLDVAMVAAVLVAASLDERARAKGRFSAPPASPRRRLPFPAVAIVFAAVAGTAALAVTPILSGVGSVRPRFPVPQGGLASGPTSFNHFVDIHERLTDLGDTVLFTAEFDDPMAAATRLRLLTLPRFEEDGFFPGEAVAETFGSDPIAHTVMIIEPFDDTWLPAISGAEEVPQGEATIAAGGVRGSQTAGLTYRVVSRPADATSTAAADSRPGEDSLSLSGLADPATIAREARRVTAGAEDDLRAGIALERHFRERRYRIPVQPGTVDLAAWLLDADATGYCEQFAVAMAVLARAEGIPSRVVVGFLPGEVTGTTVTVTGAEAHAWVELWIAGRGWLPFDPTPGSRSGPAPSDAYAGLETPASGADAGAGGLQPPPSTVPQPVPAPAAPRPWLGIVAAVVLLVPVVIVAVSSRRRRRLQRRADAGDVVAAWDLIVGRLTAVGQPPAPSSTPLEIARATSPAMTGLATGYTKHAYGTAVLDPEETVDALQSMRSTEAELIAATSPLRRLAVSSGVSAIGRAMRRRR